MSKHRKAFLVEDNAQIRESLKEALLTLSDVSVVAYAENEADAVDWLAVYSDRVNLVILDMFLTSGTGYSILKQMRDAKLIHPIVVLTNNSSEPLRANCLAAGATAFFDKSSEQEQFFDYVKNQKLVKARR